MRERDLQRRAGAAVVEARRGGLDGCIAHARVRAVWRGRRLRRRAGKDADLVDDTVRGSLQVRHVFCCECMVQVSASRGERGSG